MTENEEKNDKLEKTLKDLDWVTVTDAEDLSLFMDMEIMNVTSYKGSWYLLASCEESLSDDNGEEDDAEEDETADDETAAYIFKLVSEEEAEFTISEDYSDISLSVTTEFPAADFNEVGRIFASSDEYDLDVEESDENEQ